MMNTNKKTNKKWKLVAFHCLPESKSFTYYPSHEVHNVKKEWLIYSENIIREKPNIWKSNVEGKIKLLMHQLVGKNGTGRG